MTSTAAEELRTVDDAAQLLQLHPKTVLRFIRNGRLPATRVGKAYRIRRADLDAFAGLPPRPAQTPADAWVTSIVDVPGVGVELAQKWGRAVTSALNAKPRAGGAPMRVDVVHEPERSHLKLVLVGSPDDTARLLGLVQIWLEQLRP
jgi:excisionase family DNA binding protein